MKCMDIKYKLIIVSHGFLRENSTIFMKVFMLIIYLFHATAVILSIAPNYGAISLMNHSMLHE